MLLWADGQGTEFFGAMTKLPLEGRALYSETGDLTAKVHSLYIFILFFCAREFDSDKRALFSPVFMEILRLFQRLEKHDFQAFLAQT